MTSQPKRRWLPRFGLRSLFALVLVVAAYFGSWVWMEERAHQDVGLATVKRFNTEYDFGGATYLDAGIFRGPWPGASSTAPFVVSVEEANINKGAISSWHRRYYVWLFGWTVRLPFTSDVSNEPPDGQEYWPYERGGVI